MDTPKRVVYLCENGTHAFQLFVLEGEGRSVVITPQHRARRSFVSLLDSDKHWFVSFLNLSLQRGRPQAGEILVRLRVMDGETHYYLRLRGQVRVIPWYLIEAAEEVIREGSRLNDWSNPTGLALSSLLEPASVG